jgi:sporulation protein YlmC with PRC-barrel domain
MRDAQVVGSTYYIRGQLSYDAAARAIGSKKSFAKATDLLIENMVESLTKRLEIAFLYGGTGIGKIDSVVIDPDDKSVATLIIQSLSWSAGIWGGLENTEFDIHAGTQKPINGRGSVILQSVDVDNRSLSVTGDPLDLAAIQQGNDIFFKRAYGEEFYGFDYIFQNKGKIFEIDASKYALFKSSVYPVNGPLSLEKILSATNRAVARGLNEKVTCYINPEKFTPLSVNEAGLRRYGGEKDAANGFETIKFYSSNGEIEVVPHPFVKWGDSFILPLKRVKRIGATDITFNMPGRGDEIFLHIQDETCYELRAMADQAIFPVTPAKCVKMSGIQ